MSSLGRLFDYAKISTVDVRENYTTQALAEAIRRDPRPIIAALQEAKALSADAGEDSRVEVTTQWSFPQSPAVPEDGDDPNVDRPASTIYRYIDLVLVIEPNGSRPSTAVAGSEAGPHPSTARREVWIEVKVGSGVHNDQLERYRAYIDDHSRDWDRELVLLAPEPLPTRVRLVQMRWQAVADGVRRSGTSNEWWLDLVDYLEELGMTKDSTMPISAREATVLEDAHRLFGKAQAVLREVNASFQAPTDGTPSRYPAWFPWDSSWVLRTCQTQFSEKGRIMLWMSGKRPVSLFYGYVPIDGEVQMTVWVEADPRNTTARSQVREWARERLPQWDEIPGDAWQLVQVTQRAILVDQTVEAKRWFVDRVDEVLDAGLFTDVFPESAR